MNGPLTDLEKIYFDEKLTQLERVYKMAVFLHNKGDLHNQLFFAIEDLWEESSEKNKKEK